MKKSVVKMYESKESILKCGNHGVKVWPRPMDVLICSDKTLENEHFTATREMRYFGSTICAINDDDKTFRLSHAGVCAVDKETGEYIEGEWPKTTTQTLMMYRDLCTTDGYTELEPIEGRPGRDWRKHQEEYQARKAMLAAGIVPPRKVRRKKSKLTPELLAMLEKEYGLNPTEIMEKMQANEPKPVATPAPNLPMCIPNYAVNAVFIHDWFANYDKRSQWGVYVSDHEYANADWWEKALAEKDEPEAVVIDADYIKKLQAEKAKEKAEKAKKKTAKKATTKKAAAKKATAKKKEAVA